MPIRKFHGVEEMPPPARLTGAVWPRIRELWALSARLYPRRFPPGVYKNRTIEEANRRRQSW